MPGHYCTYSQIRITGTWVCTCDFSHLAVAVHLFPSPNANTDAGLEAGLPRLFYMEYDSSPSISGNSTVGRHHLMVSCQIPSLKNKRIPKRRHGLNECRTLSGLSPLAREKNKHLGGGLSPLRELSLEGSWLVHPYMPRKGGCHWVTQEPSSDPQQSQGLTFPFCQIMCSPLAWRKSRSSYVLISILGAESKRGPRALCCEASRSQRSHLKELTVLSDKLSTTTEP